MPEPIQKNTVAMFLALLLVATALPAPLFSQNYAERVIREKVQESSPVGRHAILSAGVVDLEYRIDKASMSTSKLPTLQGTTQNYSQQMGLGTRIKLSEKIDLQHDVLFGVSRSDDWFESDIEDNHRQQLKQRQISTVNWKFFDQAALWASNEISTEIRQDEVRGAEVMRQASGLRVFMPLGIRLSPELSHETTTNSELVQTQLNRLSMTVDKNLVPKYLDLQFKPSYSESEQLYDGGAEWDSRRLDMGLTWKPDPSLQCSAGVNYQETNNITDYAETLYRGVYTQLQHSPWSGLQVRVRGDFQATEKDYLDETSKDTADTRMNLSMGPNIVLSEDFTAGAELRFQYLSNPAEGRPMNEQMLSVSLRGQF